MVKRLPKNKIIDGRRYDIKAAVVLHEWSNKRLDSDPDYLSEVLYRKKNGEYFLYGKGGANTRYGNWKGVNGTAGEKIMPIAPSEARTWAELHATPEEYTEMFGLTEGKTRMYFNRVSPETRYKMEQIQEQTGKTLIEIFEAAIREYQG